MLRPVEERVVSVLQPPASIWVPLAPYIGDFLRRINSVRVPGSTFGYTSWWRSAQHNAAVGGNPRSQHLLGLAADTTPNSGANRIALKQAFFNAGLWALDEGDHIHVQRYTAGVIPQSWYQLVV